MTYKDYDMRYKDYIRGGRMGLAKKSPYGETALSTTVPVTSQPSQIISHNLRPRHNGKTPPFFL